MAIKGYNFYEDRPVLASFYQREKQGMKLSIDNLTESVLTALWIDELVSDNEIAIQFNITAMEVRELRRVYGITHSKCMNTYAEKAKSILGSLGASIMVV